MEETKEIKEEEKKEVGEKRSESDATCYYRVDPCGCFVDPCGCVVDPCGCYVDPCCC